MKVPRIPGARVVWPDVESLRRLRRGASWTSVRAKAPSSILGLVILAAMTSIAFGFPLVASAADVFVGTPPLNPVPGQQVSIELFVDVGAGTLGSYSTTFVYDPSVVQIVSVTGGTTAAFSGPPITNPASFASGATPLAAVQGTPVAPSGFISVATLTLEAVGNQGDSSALGLSGTVLFSGSGAPVQAVVFGSSFLIGAVSVPALGKGGLGLLILLLLLFFRSFARGLQPRPTRVA